MPLNPIARNPKAETPTLNTRRQTSSTSRRNLNSTAPFEVRGGADSTALFHSCLPHLPGVGRTAAVCAEHFEKPRHNTIVLFTFIWPPCDHPL